MKSYYWLLLILFTGMMSCSGGDKENNEAEETIETALVEETNEVNVMTLELADFNHELVSNGKLSARRSVDLRFTSAEPIAHIYVKNGDRVKKGQKLAELAPFRLQSQTATSKDALERAKLELQDVLIGQGYTLADSAKVPEATMKLVRVRSGYDQALIQYQMAVYEEQNAILTAPFDGVVANLFAKEHNTASTTERFCSIIDPGSLEATFTVLENELPLIKAGDRVEVTPYAMTNTKVDGRISEINPLVDANGMVQVKAAVSGNGKLFEGMNVRVNIHRSLGKQLIVPKTAVVLRSGKQVVFKLDASKEHAVWVYVTTGLENADSYTIATSEGDGLHEGDLVITNNNINLAHDAPVKVIGN